MIKFRALFFSVVVMFGVLAGGIVPAWAATSSKGVSLTTSPISVGLTAKPGTSVTTTLQVMNNSSSALKIHLGLQTFRPYGNSGQAQIYKPTSGDDFINWVTFSQNDFLTQPGVWTPVQMTINLPTSAALDYYYAVLFQPTTPNATSGLSTTLKSSNAILVLLNAQTPNEKPRLEVTSFSSAKHIYEYLPATFLMNVYNNGNTYLAPTGNVFISKNSNFKNIIASLNINQSSGNVLPGSSRLYTTQWTDGFPVFVPKTVGGVPITSQGQTVEQLKWNFAQSDKFRFGKYYAKMVLVYNNGVQDVPITAVVSFWVIPWKLILLFIFLLACIVGLVILVIRLSHKVKKQTKWRV